LKKENRMKEVENSVITDNAKGTMSGKLFSDIIIWKFKKNFKFN